LGIPAARNHYRLAKNTSSLEGPKKKSTNLAVFNHLGVGKENGSKKRKGKDEGFRNVREG